MTANEVPSAILALDQGGHSSRALVFDRAGELLAHAQIPVATHTPDELRVEQDAREVVDSLRRAIVDVVGRLGAPIQVIEAAGLATQRSSIVCWSREDGAALSPVLSWQDRRNLAQIESLRGHEVDIHTRTGLFLSPHYGASKMRWCLDHLPTVRDAAQRGTLAVAPLASFLAHQLTAGRAFCVDPANAGRTLLWNLATRDWDDELLARFGVPRTVLPRVVPTCSRIGNLDLPGRVIPLRALQGDQPAALFADGWPRADRIYINIGTGAFLQRPFASLPPPMPRHLRSLVLQAGGEREIFTVEATVNGAASAVDWLCARQGRACAPADLARALDEVVEPPLFLNGVGGLAAPWWLPGFEPAFDGSDGGFVAELAAVVESVAFLIAVNVDYLAALPPAPTEIVLSGGWSWLDGLARRVAALTGLAVRCLSQAEATARGVAFLAAGGPEVWRADAPRTRFVPAVDTGLIRRYARWREAMRRRSGRSF